jgi:hypothetical protein
MLFEQDPEREEFLLEPEEGLAVVFGRSGLGGWRGDLAAGAGHGRFFGPH